MLSSGKESERANLSRMATGTAFSGSGIGCRFLRGLLFAVLIMMRFTLAFLAFFMPGIMSPRIFHVNHFQDRPNQRENRAAGARGYESGRALSARDRQQHRRGGREAHTMKTGGPWGGSPGIHEDRTRAGTRTGAAVLGGIT
jgi:hypothetical protein